MTFGGPICPLRQNVQRHAGRTKKPGVREMPSNLFPLARISM